MNFVVRLKNINETVNEQTKKKIYISEFLLNTNIPENQNGGVVALALSIGTDERPDLEVFKHYELTLTPSVRKKNGTKPQS